MLRNKILEDRRFQISKDMRALIDLEFNKINNNYLNSKKNMKTKKEIKEFYGKSYKPNKNCKPVTYKGKQYLSKAQCMALEGITVKELNEYLKNNQ